MGFRHKRPHQQLTKGQRHADIRRFFAIEGKACTMNAAKEVTQ